MEVKIKLHEGGKIPERHGAMYDLFTAEDVVLSYAGQFKLISLGISMELPRGYFAKIYSRSSTFKKYGITMANSVGIIDNKYNGDNDIWMFPALAHKAVEIPAGTRICQFEICAEGPVVKFQEVESLGNEDRGGFGSTGTN